MFIGVPFFKGRNVADEIQCIFAILGTPNVQDYPSVKELPLWSTYSHLLFPTKNIAELVPALDADGFELVSVRGLIPNKICILFLLD
jgi:cyclin-dependent kinase 5